MAVRNDHQKESIFAEAGIYLPDNLLRRHATESQPRSYLLLPRYRVGIGSPITPADPANAISLRFGTRRDRLRQPSAGEVQPGAIINGYRCRKAVAELAMQRRPPLLFTVAMGQNGALRKPSLSRSGVSRRGLSLRLRCRRHRLRRPLEIDCPSPM
jgi:hypothetical protein